MCLRAHLSLTLRTMIRLQTRLVVCGSHQITSPGIYRAITALMILGTGTPMLFQGQEFGSTAPFLYFADMPEGLLPLVRDGRKEFMSQWRSLHNQSMLDGLADPVLA